MAFDTATRRKIVQLAAQGKPAGGGSMSFQLPRTGLLGRVYLAIRGTVAGTLSDNNALGMASIIRRVRLTANSGIDVFNISGPGYHYLLRDHFELEKDATPQSNARDAVSATDYNVDMVIPVSINQRDPIGLLMLQSEQTLLTLHIDFESDGNVATGATVDGTVTPYLELFTVPTDEANWPPLNVVHQILEDQQQVPAAGQFTYNWPRGNTYLQVFHGLGIGESGSDDFTQIQLRVNQSDYLLSADPTFLDMERAYSGFEQRLPGVIPFDLMGSAGMGMFDKTRDTINSSLVTDLATVIEATGAGTMYTVRRQLVNLG